MKRINTLFAIFILLCLTSQVEGQEKNEELTKERVAATKRVRWIYFSLLRNPFIKKKFDLTNDQIKKLNVAERKITAIRSQIKPQDKSKENRKLIVDYYLELEEQGRQLEKILVRHQLESMNYVYYWTFVRNETYFGLLDRFVASEVNISKEQQEILKAESTEAVKALNEELKPLDNQITKAKKEYLEKVLSALTEDQRKKYLELFDLRLIKD